MYKGAHRAMVHRTAVDRPHPSRGFIDGPSDPSDALPEAASMTMAAAEEEAARLRFEISRVEQEIAVAKAAGDNRRAASAGARKMTVQNRLKHVKARIRELHIRSNGDALRAAMKEILDGPTYERIVARASELRGEGAA